MIATTPAGPSHMNRSGGWLLVAFMVAMAAACGDGASTTTAPSIPTKPAAENWSSVLAPGGASSRSFTVTAAGTISVTMTSAGATVGLGVGLPRVSGGGCRLGVSVNTGGASTPQITTQADAGQYCVQVFDLGTLIDPISFTLTIDHP